MVKVELSVNQWNQCRALSFTEVCLNENVTCTMVLVIAQLLGGGGGAKRISTPPSTF